MKVICRKKSYYNTIVIEFLLNFHKLNTVMAQTHLLNQNYKPENDFCSIYDFNVSLLLTPYPSANESPINKNLFLSSLF